MFSPGRWVGILLFAGSLWAQSYTTQKSNTSESLRGVGMVSKQVAWASGTKGTYLRTVDGGRTWSVGQVTGAESLDFRDVEAFGLDVAYLLAAGPGELSRIYKTVDAGKTWALQFTNHEPKGFFDCMAFWNREQGIAVGDPANGKFEVIKTENGGKNWESVSASLPAAMDGEGAFAASGTCVAVEGKSSVWFATGGKVARVFRSSDAGKSWSVAETPIVHGADSEGIFSIAFRDARHGVIAGGDYKHPEKGGANLAFTEDGGATWKVSALTPQFYFSAAAYVGGGVALVGSTHAAYLDDVEGESWKKVWDLNLNAVSVGPDGTAIGVGPKGTIVRFELR